jgi:photosystem II stability/assembly factor-like uncharacterized protein
MMTALFVVISALAINAQHRDDADDADVPSIARGKVDKRTYMRLREEHINKLRGLDKDNQAKQRESRARAIRKLDEQQRQQQKKAGVSLNNRSADATMMSTETGTNAPTAPVTGSWTPIGPAPISNGQTFSVVNSVSGRVTAIAVSPANGNVIYVGTAQGGVYRTLDGGANWTPITDNALSLAIGAITIDPSNPTRVYVGTGEANYAQRTYFGVGVYRIDNAESEEPTRTLTLMNLDAAGNDVFGGRSISKILVTPNNPDTIFVSTASGFGGVSSDVAPGVAATPPHPLRGIYRSTNATTASPTFAKLDTSPNGNLSIADMVFDPVDGSYNTIVYSVLNNGATTDGGIYRMSGAQGTSSYVKLLTVGTSTGSSRVNLAFNSTGTILLATAEESSGTLRKSTDRGTTWTTLTAASGFCGGQCWYDAPVAIAANGYIYIGGNADGTSSSIMKRSTDNGSTFAKIENGLHADSHAIAFDPVDSNIVYTGNDGGFFKSTTGGTGNWQSLNGGLNGGTPINSMQYMSVAVHPSDPYFTIGGTQDNGTHRIKTDGTWTRTDYGDGGWALIDQSSTSLTSVRQYHTYYNQAGIGGLMGFAITTSPTAFENWSFYGCGGARNGIKCTDSAVLFYAPMTLGPGSPNTVYYGSDKIYRSSNGGTSMSAVSQTFTSGVAVSAIGISPQNDAVRIVGLEDGKVFKTTTGATTLTNVTPFGNTKYVARAVVDPNNQNTAYVTLSGFYGADNGQHVYKTTNLNATTPTWTVAGVGIPDVPVNGFIVDKATGNLYAGTDIGVYMSTNGGASWTAYSTGLPRVAVFDMAITANRVLRIATHGRGMWEIQL